MKRVRQPKLFVYTFLTTIIQREMPIFLRVSKQFIPHLVPETKKSFQSNQRFVAITVVVNTSETLTTYQKSMN